MPKVKNTSTPANSSRFHSRNSTRKNVKQSSPKKEIVFEINKDAKINADLETLDY